MRAWLAATLVLCCLSSTITLLSFQGIIWLNQRHVTVLKTVNPLQNIQISELESLAHRYRHKSFWGTALHTLSEDLLTLPWVKAVTLKRRWPSEWILAMTEYTALANWQNEAVLTSAGTLIPVQASPQLPLWLGAPQRIIEYIQDAQLITTLLESSDLRAYQLDWRQEGQIQIFLNNGLRLYCKQSSLKKELSRMLTIYQDFYTTYGAHIAYLDMRYHNGLAIGWKTDRKESVLALNHSH